MKDLYIISIELDETSEYFAELTPKEAAKIRAVLKKTGDKFTIDKIREAPGFNSFQDLLTDFKDMIIGKEKDAKICRA